MARRFAYQDDSALGAVVGQSLGRALFGDPAMAQAQQEHVANLALRDAQAAQANAHARLYGSQADIAGTQAGAIKSLPDLFKHFVTQPAPVASEPLMAVDPALDPSAAIGYSAPPAEAAAPVFDQGAFRSGLPAVFAALAQARGENVDPNEIVGGLAAMLGDDGLARRGLVTMGHTPGENFALDIGRADAISARDAKEDLGKALAVENIQSGDRRYGVDVRSGDTRRGQDIASTDRQRGQDIKADGSYDRNSAISLGNTLGRVTSTVRSPEHNKKVGGVGNSYHLSSRGGRGIDIARAAGVTHAQVVQKYRNAGYTILEDLDEGDHSHLALSGGPGAAKGKKAGGPAVKAVDKSDRKMISEIIDGRLDKDKPGYQRLKSSMMRRSIQLYQQTGNPDDAVAQAYKESGLGKPKAAPSSGGDPALLRREAQQAIAAGADRGAVAARFKQMTGQAL